MNDSKKVSGGVVSAVNAGTRDGHDTERGTPCQPGVVNVGGLIGLGPSTEWRFDGQRFDVIRYDMMWYA